MLVTIGIIAILVGILVPMVNRARASAHRIRLQGDLQTISAALESYRSDFGDYPRAEYAAGFSITDPAHPNPPRGAEILCRALIGPAPALDSTVTGTSVPAQDGADGPGFRLRGTSGRVYGPYLAADKFKVYSLYASTTSVVPAETSSNQPSQSTITTGTFYPSDAVIGDIDGNPILYFPARANRPDITGGTNHANEGYLAAVSAVPPSGTGVTADSYVQYSLFNADDGWIYMHYQFNDGQVSFRSSADSSEASGSDTLTSAGFRRIAIMLGDYDANNSSASTNYDGSIDEGNEHPVNLPFVLWCAGQDGKFGPDSTTPSASDIAKLDDATNIQ